jgi:hypothetical protein
MSLDEAFAPIETVVKANIANPSLGRGNVRATWKRIAAADVRSWRVRYGDEAAPDIYRRALRDEPFQIRGTACRAAAESERVLSQVASHDAATPRNPRIGGSVAAVIHGILSTRAACALPAATNGRRPHVPLAMNCHRTPIGTSGSKLANRDAVIFSSRGSHVEAVIRFDPGLDCPVWVDVPDDRNPETIHLVEKSACIRERVDSISLRERPP